MTNMISKLFKGTVSAVIIILFIQSCTNAKSGVSNFAVRQNMDDSSAQKEVDKKPKFVPDYMPYQPSVEKINDLIHTNLEVSFSW